MNRLNRKLLNSKREEMGFSRKFFFLISIEPAQMGENGIEKVTAIERFICLVSF